MSDSKRKNSPDLDASFDLAGAAVGMPRRWPRAGIRKWTGPQTRQKRYYVTFWDAPGVRHSGLFSADPWFETFEEADDHARLVVGNHWRQGVTLSGESNTDYLR